MITKIGVICQDASSLGFLRGLRRRLECEAEFVGPPAPIGKNSLLTTKNAKMAWEYFRKKNVDLIVRFTDADKARWQTVRRRELDVFPDEARDLLVCGVAVKNVEDWLCIDTHYLAESAGIPRTDLADPQHRTGRIKRAIQGLANSGVGKSDVVEKLVADADPEVFKRWLVDESFRGFYTDCRAAASRANCETPNELEPSS